jgi:hypothetical protein
MPTTNRLDRRQGTKRLESLLENSTLVIEGSEPTAPGYIGMTDQPTTSSSLGRCRPELGISQPVGNGGGFASSIAVFLQR